MKNPSKKKGLNGRRTKTSKRKAPKRTEKTETVITKNRKRTKSTKYSTLIYNNENLKTKF